MSDSEKMSENMEMREFFKPAASKYNEQLITCHHDLSGYCSRLVFGRIKAHTLSISFPQSLQEKVGVLHEPFLHENLMYKNKNLLP
jgi:hypothetical protein